MHIGPPSLAVPSLPAPERLQLIDVIPGEPSRLTGVPDSGSAILRWYPPVGMSSTLRSGSEFIIESWEPEKYHWRPVARCSVSISAETVPGRYDLRIDGMTPGRPHYFRVLTESMDARSEPTMLSHPVLIPFGGMEKRTIPEPPSRLKVFPITGDRHGALITWLPPLWTPISEPTTHTKIPRSFAAPPTGYRLEYQLMPSSGRDRPEWKHLIDLEPWQTSYEVPELEPGKQYIFRVSSIGQRPDGRTTPSYRRSSRATEKLTTAILSEPIESTVFELSSDRAQIPRITGALSVLESIDHTATTPPSVSLSWQPVKEPVTGYVVDLFDLNADTGWRTFARLPSHDVRIPFSGTTVSGLIPGHSYRFRVIPYKDDVYGLPLQSTTIYTTPKTPLATEVTAFESLKIPAPRGPLRVECLPTGYCRLSWHPPRLPAGVDIRTQPIKETDIEYVIEQRVPHRRMWFELGRTRLLHFLTPLDNTSQFRVRTVFPSLTDYKTIYSDHALSYDAIQSDWISAEQEQQDDSDILHRHSKRVRSSVISDEDIDLNHLVPERLRATHVGRTSALLEWTPIQDIDLFRHQGYLLLEKRIVDKYRLGVWEPVARIPFSSMETSYEVSGLHTNTQYDFRLVSLSDFKGLRSSKHVCLTKPLITQGLKADPEHLVWLSAPRRPSVVVSSVDPEDEIHLHWLAPEVSESIRSKLRYRIEARVIDSTGRSLTSWLCVAPDWIKADYTISRSKLSALYDLKSSMADLDNRHWQFRILSTVDDQTSIPAMVAETITLVPSKKRKNLNFLRLTDTNILYCTLGQRFSLMVEVEGEPSPSITWYLNHIRLDDQFSSDYHINQLTPGSYELVIDRILQSHAGLLECQAKNAYETITTSWEIFVAAAPRFNRFGWIIQPREFELKHGDRFYLQIPLDGMNYLIRRSDYDWITKVWLERITRILVDERSLDTEALESRARVQISANHQFVELIVDRVGLIDSGLYRLWIQNQAGQDYIDLRLRVADKPHITPNRPRVRPHGPGTLVIDWDVPIPRNQLEAAIRYTGYRVEYCRDTAHASWQFLGTTSADRTRLLVGSQLETGVDYRFRVLLENWHGVGPASDASDVAQLPVHSITEIIDTSIPEPLRFSDTSSFESRYSIIGELARTKHARLCKLKERSTGREWLAKILDTSDGSPERRVISELDRWKQLEEQMTTSVPPRSTSISEMDERRISSGFASQTSLADLSEWRRERAERELKLFSRIQHSNLAQLHEAYQDTKRTIWVMEDVTAGGTLWHDFTRRITLTENKAADILKQLLSLTDQLHRAGVVHLGFQPENIFYTDRTKRRVALASVGQSHVLEEERPIRLTFRSAVYLPPELKPVGSTAVPVTSGQEHPVGPASDLWSLGLLTYQMTTGDIEGHPKPEKMERLKISPKAIDFTKKLLHPDPTQRPTAAQALKHPWIESLTSKRSESVSRTVTTPVAATIERTTAEVSKDEGESIDHNVAEAISQRAFTRLLRWMDASNIEEDTEMEQSQISRRLHYRKGSYQHFLERDSEFTESKEDIVVHARMGPRGQIPEILTPMGSVTVEEGNATVLRCAVHLPRPRRSDVLLDRMSDLRIRWSLNGRELRLPSPTLKFKQLPNQHYTCTFDPETGEIKLHIDEVNVYDAGTYEVVVIGQYGEVSDSANLKVYASTPRPPSRTLEQVTEELGACIVQPLVDMSAVMGHKVILKAKVAGIPAPRCTWLHNGVPITSSSRRRFLQTSLGGIQGSESLLSLEIANVTSVDSGLYTLVATNKYGSQSCSAVIDILAALPDDHEMPHFLVDLVSTTVVEGSAVRFEACARGRPAPIIRWLKDGKPLLTDGIRMLISQSSMEHSVTNTTSHTLVIRDAVLRDCGTYSCIATSSAGTAISEAALHVRALFSRSVHGSMYEAPGLTVRARQPEFTRRLRNQQVNLGGSVRLAASILAQPSATVAWQKDGLELETGSPYSDPRISSKNQSGHLELLIEDITPDDLGQYTVIAYNPAGEAKCSCTVTLLDEKQFRLPRFTRELKNQNVLEGTTVCLEATATGEPLPDFKWEKDGFEILPDESGPPRIVPSTGSGGLAYLTINHVRSSDAGLYRCTAHNRYGRERSIAFVYVEKGSRPADRPPNELPSVTPGGHIGRGRSLPPSTHLSTKAIPGYMDVHHPALIESERSVSPPKTGFLRVLQSLPKQVDVEEGEALTLKCLVSSNIHFIPTWSKAGRTLTYDGRRRITRSKTGELSLVIDHVMTNDEGRYTLTLEPSDASAPKTLEPVVMATRVDVDLKLRTRFAASRGSSRSDSRAPSLLNGRSSKDR